MRKKKLILGRIQIDSTFPATLNLQIESLEEMRFVKNTQLLFTGECTTIDLQKTRSYSGRIVGIQFSKVLSV